MKNRSSKLADFTEATVIDIKDAKYEINFDKLLIDANVLLFYYYDRWNQLSKFNLGARYYQLKEYSRFFKRVLSSNVSVFVHEVCLLEFTHFIESVELKLLDCKKKGLTSFDPENFKLKDARCLYKEDSKHIRSTLATYLNPISKRFYLVSNNDSIDQILGNLLIEWQSSNLADINDAAMIVEAKKLGIKAIISDDSDFISFKGIDLYTANDVAIEAYNKKVAAIN
ncbi:MAG: hypothetical protein P9M06_01970 [Candidatus Saelkia tenebricola]|nr:hypothetical protein [Candidatus Saelkia tenebricola]